MQIELIKDSKSKKKIVNVASVPHRSPFRYPGGKTWFIPTFRAWISSQNRKPKFLVEPFAGGGIVGLTAAFEDLVEKVVLVELDEDVSAVWETLIKGDFERLAKEIVEFELNFDNAVRLIETKPRSLHRRAFQTIIRNRVSHGGIMAPGSGLIKNGENGKGISSRWYPATLARRITDIGKVRDKLNFIHGSGVDVIPDYIQSKSNCIFVDPPYTAGGKRAGRRLYRYHELDHEKLFEDFVGGNADFLFTYDISEEILGLAKKSGFQTTTIPMKNTHHAEMTELIVGKDLAWLANN